MDINFPKRDLS